MGVSKLTTLGAVLLDSDYQDAAVTLGGIRSQMLRSGLDVRQETTSGAVSSQWQSVYAATPLAEFSTVSLQRALDVVGTTGLRISATVDTGMTLYGTGKGEGGGRQAGGNHVSYNIKEGILLPRRISVSHQGDAELSLETLITYDGQNAPIVQSNAASVPGSVADDQRFSIGPVQLGTTSGDSITITQISNLEIDFGIIATAEGSDSDIYPNFATIQDIPRPMIRITTSDPLLLAKANGIPWQGKGLDASHTVFYLSKRARLTASGYLANNVAEHIAIVPLIGCAYLSDLGSYNASGPNGSVVIEIPFISDGQSAPWAWDTTSTISFPL